MNEEWVVLAKYDEVQANEKQRALKEETAKTRAELREFLTSQVKLREEEARKAREEQVSWAKVFEVSCRAANALSPLHTGFA